MSWSSSSLRASSVTVGGVAIVAEMMIGNYNKISKADSETASKFTDAAKQFLIAKLIENSLVIHWCGEHTLPYMVMKSASGKITSAYCKNKLVVLTTSGYPVCRQTEETVVMRALLWIIA